MGDWVLWKDSFPDSVQSQSRISSDGSPVVGSPERPVEGHGKRDAPFGPEARGTPGWFADHAPVRLHRRASEGEEGLTTAGKTRREVQEPDGNQPGRRGFQEGERVKQRRAWCR